MGAERNAIDRVHRYLPREMHKESMTGAFQNGRPDYYYDGPRSDLWVEWKTGELYYENGTVLVEFEATTLQQKWIARRSEYGGNVVTFVALPDKTIVCTLSPKSWQLVRTNQKKKRHVFRAPVVATFTAQEVARWIASFCSGA